jgi:uncharacterized protein (TIGR02594 family)
MQQPPWMTVAWAELGVAERTGAATNPRIAAYFRAVGHPEVADDETAWCAAFVGACLESAGLKCTRSLSARSYLDWGVGMTELQPGAVIVLERGSDPALGHVGFLVGETPQSVILLGGNQSNAVTVQAFDRARVIGCRLPDASAVGAATPEVLPQAEPADGFERALAHVLEFEGGWSDDPFDPGGPTNKGITLATFARERGLEVTAETISQIKAELADISDGEVRRIYRERYWTPACCPLLPSPLAFFHFDAAVNQGVAGAARMLQEALRVEIDGEIGPITLAAARAAEPALALAAYAEIRRRHYRSLGHFWRFGRGWLRRVDRALERARALVGPGPGSPRRPSSSQEKPAMTPADTHEQAPSPEPRPGKWWGESLTIWGALLTAVATVAPAVFAAFGIDMPAELVQRLGRDLTTVIQAIAGLAGTIMTILGRIRAAEPIGRRTVSIRL